MQTELLIDANSVAWRNLFALDKLCIRVGDRKLLTGMAFGLLATIIQMRSKRRFSRINLFWDAGNYRKKDIHPLYKSGRKLVLPGVTHADLQLSIRLCVRLLKFAGVPQYRVAREEADDLISSYAATYPGEHMILSSDHDLLQLLSDRVRVLRLEKSGPSLWTPTRFKAEYGFEPTYFSHFLAIVGDPMDKVPGVRGIGKVTGEKIFRQLKEPTIKNIYDQLPNLEISDKQLATLARGREDADKFFQIVNLRTDIPLEPMFDLKPDYRALVQLLKKTRMRRMYAQKQTLALLCGIG